MIITWYPKVIMSHFRKVWKGGLMNLLYIIIEMMIFLMLKNKYIRYYGTLVNLLPSTIVMDLFVCLLEVF